MPVFKNKIIYLLKVYSTGEATPAEEQLLFRWLNNTADKGIIYKHIESILKEYESPEIKVAVNWEIVFQKIKDNIK